MIVGFVSFAIAVICGTVSAGTMGPGNASEALAVPAIGFTLLALLAALTTLDD